MNRREYRQANRARLRRESVSLESVRCPDCDSDVALIEQAPGVYQGRVYHDPSCPWLAQLERDLS